MRSGMNRSRTVSVIIPTYNRAHYLEEAIESVLNQDIRDCRIEIIVVDDGSTDNTKEVLGKFGNRVRYIYQDNCGAGPARNRGINEATGEWVAFLDSDDRWLPGKLTLQFKVLDAFPDYNAIHSEFLIFDETGILTDKGLQFWVSDPSIWEKIVWDKIYSTRYESADYHIHAVSGSFPIYAGNIFASQLIACCISNWTLLVRRDCLQKEMRFAENYKLYEDYWFICRLTERCDILFMDIATAENRAHKGPRLTEAGYIERFKTHIDICNKIFRSSNSIHRPSDKEIDNVFKLLNIMLFKKYLKDGMRSEARKTHAVIRKLNGPTGDRTYFLYRLTLWFPLNIVKNLIAFKGFIKRRLQRITCD
jgi:glycosyltransferase involved in cell wall biosynthesis